MSGVYRRPGLIEAARNADGKRAVGIIVGVFLFGGMIGYGLGTERSQAPAPCADTLLEQSSSEQTCPPGATLEVFEVPDGYDRIVCRCPAPAP